MLQITGSRNTTFFIALVFDMDVILLVLILYRCRLLTSTIWWWLVAELNFELSDSFSKRSQICDSFLDTQCTYIDNDFHFYYHIV